MDFRKIQVRLVGPGLGDDGRLCNLAILPSMSSIKEKQVLIIETKYSLYIIRFAPIVSLSVSHILDTDKYYPYLPRHTNLI